MGGVGVGLLGVDAVVLYQEVGGVVDAEIFPFKLFPQHCC